MKSVRVPFVTIPAYTPLWLYTHGKCVLQQKYTHFVAYNQLGLLSTVMPFGNDKQLSSKNCHFYQFLRKSLSNYSYYLSGYIGFGFKNYGKL